ncbi:MAG: CAP domain-containing protein [Methanoregula sp.]|uniref:CAP domain-containing protein n=1 Tax=Methanoregula sp. TaxID=2052170 RepID=UPI003C70C459
MEIIHQEVNIQRAKAERNPLELDENICEVAQAWAEYLITIGKLDHEDKKYKGGSTVGKRLHKAGIGWQKCGENLTTYTPNDVVQGWMGSPGHRNNLLNHQFQKEGIGVAWYGGRCVCCQVLISPSISPITSIVMFFSTIGLFIFVGLWSTNSLISFFGLGIFFIALFVGIRNTIKRRRKKRRI